MPGFPTTRWSQAADAGGPTGSLAREALTGLSLACGFPVHAIIAA
jgi:hypothetical protein